MTDKTTHPTYVDRLDLHEGPVETNHEPLNRKFSGKPHKTTTVCRWDDDWRQLGYLQWHYQAERWHKAGATQSRCPICLLWKFPAEECERRKMQRGRISA